MNTSLKWIKDLVPGLDCTPQEYMDAMTLSGSKVEGYENMDEDLDKIVIGQVKSIEKHPDADKLVICQVDIGTETIQIVTGAPNVTEGCKVPVVLDGGKVAGGHDGSKTEGGIKIKTARCGVKRYDVLHRGTWFKQRYVPTCTGKRFIYPAGRCSGRRERYQLSWIR